MLSLRDAIDVYTAAAPDLAVSSRDRMIYEVRRWNRVMLTPDPGEISTESFGTFRARALQRQLSPRSIEDSISTVRLLLTTIRGQAPHPGRRLKRSAPLPQPARPDELLRLWAAADEMSWPVTHTWRTPALWWRAWLSIGFWTGLRLTDLTWRLSLQHWGEFAIVFQARKTGVQHCFPVVPQLEWIRRRGSVATHRPILWCGRSATRLRNHLSRLCAAAGVRRMTPKNLRQSAVTAWTKADTRAGEIIHGCGMPRVLCHYLDPLDILLSAVPRVEWPFPKAGSPQQQLTLF